MMYARLESLAFGAAAKAIGGMFQDQGTRRRPSSFPVRNVCE